MMTILLLSGPVCLDGQMNGISHVVLSVDAAE